MRAALFVVAIGTPTDWELVKQGKELPGDRELDMVNARMAAMAEKMEQNNKAVVEANPMLGDRDGLKKFLQDPGIGASLLESVGPIEHIKAKPLTADEERQQNINKFDSVSDSLDKLTNFVQKGGAKIKADADFFEKQIAAQREEQDRRLHPAKYAAGPTSFAQTSENPDDGFAKVEAKLKALQEKIKADTAKFEQEAKAAPSSLIQRTASIAEGIGAAAQSWSLDTPQDPMEKMEAQFSSIEDQMQAQTRKFEEQAKQDALIEQRAMSTGFAGQRLPSSFLQTASADFQAGVMEKTVQLKKALEQESSLYTPKWASSLLQESENPDDGFAKVEAKLKALQEKIKADTAKFEQEAKAAPSSLLQESESPDDGFAKVEAKLKALQEKIKADTAKFEQEAKAAPSSLLQESENPDDGFAKVEAKLKALQEKIKADTAKFEQEAKAAPSSFIQMTADETEDKLSALMAQLDRLQAQVSKDQAKFAAEAHQVPSSLAEIDIGDPSEEDLMERIKVLGVKMEAVKNKFLAEADTDDAAARRAADRSSLVEENMRKA